MHFAVLFRLFLKFAANFTLHTMCGHSRALQRVEFATNKAKKI